MSLMRIGKASFYIFILLSLAAGASALFLFSMWATGTSHAWHVKLNLLVSGGLINEVPVIHPVGDILYGFEPLEWDSPAKAYMTYISCDKDNSLRRKYDVFLSAHGNWESIEIESISSGYPAYFPASNSEEDIKKWSTLVTDQMALGAYGYIENKEDGILLKQHVKEPDGVYVRWFSLRKRGKCSEVNFFESMQETK